MKKKGFTLIELLAVIVILAIIALIATPLVLKYIEYSKEKSAKISANTYAEAVEKEYVSKLTNNEKMLNKEYTIKELDEIGVKVKGDKPEGDSDTVTLQNGNVIKYTLTIKGYAITYENGNTTVTPEKDENSGNGKIEALDYTVKFMVDGEPYQIVTVKKGQTVSAPNIEPIKEDFVFANWGVNDVGVIFPVTPDKDIELTALFTESQVSQIYHIAGVDRKQYPEFLLDRSNWGMVYLFFGTGGFRESGNMIYCDGDWIQSNDLGSSYATTIDAMIELIKSKASSITFSEPKTADDLVYTYNMNHYYWRSSNNSKLGNLVK